MAYCTIDELADALHIRVTAENTASLTQCVEAAATELDAWLDQMDTSVPIAPAPNSPPLVNRDNVYRAVQWFKSSDIALGGGGASEVGLITPTEPWKPMSIVPYKEQWGIA